MAYERVKWADEGMDVWVLRSRDGKTLVRAKVVCACGDMLHVADPNRRPPLDCWVATDEAFVERGDPHGVGYVSHALRVQRRYNREVARTRDECIPEHGVMTAETEEAERVIAVRVLAGIKPGEVDVEERPRIQLEGDG